MRRAESSWPAAQPTVRSGSGVLAPAVLSFSADGTLLAAGCLDGRVLVWDPAVPRLLRHHRHGTPITALVYSPDGATIAFADASETLHLCDARATMRP
jgi:WD40 repeat protein